MLLGDLLIMEGEVVEDMVQRSGGTGSAERMRRVVRE